MEVRLANLERVMGALDGRVASLERLEVEDNGANRRSKQTDHQIHLTSRSLDLETNGASPIDAPDPTDGIGSMTFVKEEESGFFVSTADPESPNYAALQGFMFRASSTSSPVVDSLNMRTAVRREVEPFSLPDQEQATQLIRRFFKTTGSLYPYLDEEAFLNTYQQSAIGNVRSLRGSWLALLNMVFAMATHAGHNQGPLPSESDSDHDLFYQRALILFLPSRQHISSDFTPQMH
ncbi:hypothetical protein N0V91_011092 [Didymella pomorum]|uniref:Uncharacterized protein n=1 Tax=Didymella pomorum TaxID=749634 RepID=A0A9W9D0L9_9PLEO|nr:hypothetical protein N0V91_011092 [Didymella pomorum]